MSDRSVEDEILTEASRFGSAMVAAVQRHAQAANWLERRRARRDISRLVRDERRREERLRAQHLTWTNQAVDRYRAHADVVARRATDPAIDGEQRARDARSLAAHRDDLAEMFVGNERLTRTEQGIALDGLDAATMFPEYKTGNLFARAHKVKGIEALHYRARVAREIAAIRERTQAHQQHSTGHAPHVPREQYARTAAAHNDLVIRNGALADENARLTRQLAEVTAERDDERDASEGYWQDVQDLAAERNRLQAKLQTVVGELRAELAAERARGDVVQSEAGQADNELERMRQQLDEVTAERDRLRGERDEAVAKLVERTPPPQRFGSRERIAADERLGNTQPIPRDLMARLDNEFAHRLAEKRRAGREESNRDWNELVGENISRAPVLQDLPESHIARRQLGEVEWAQMGLKGGEDGNEIASKWVNGGAAKYWAERDAAPEQGARPAHRSALADHQPGRSPLADAVSRNEAGRSAVDRDEVER
ncbi:hypothetical protein ACWDSJ_13920 [Nocardia sp. NPDC003482]